jgi:hypothetical protein
MGPHTLRAHLNYLFGNANKARSVPSWPPDLFGSVASVLHCTGAYRHVIESWPPARGHRPGTWATWIRHIGLGWRRTWRPRSSASFVPRQVREWWEVIIDQGATDLSEIAGHKSLCDALIQLLAVADEACVGFGTPGGAIDPVSSTSEDRAFDYAQELLITDLDQRGATLCTSIHSTKLRVLPKLHTPQTGLTIRSLSHNVALCHSNEIVPSWSVIPRAERKTKLNILLLPWPLTLSSDQFSAVPPSAHLLANLPGRYGLFTFTAIEQSPLETWLAGVVSETKKHVEKIDGIIFPELSLTRRQFEAIRKTAVKEGAFLISGIAERASRAGFPGRNFLRFEVPLAEEYVFSLPEQDKHHRWQLEGRQIGRYGLEKRLDANGLWWEYSRLKSRILNFAALYDWLTVSVLICEDLARPDPVGDLVRAVGPDLVIALLMDGSQTPERWSARYATVLADDPGCSVLTLTSLGMTQLGSPSDKAHARNIALWKEAKGGPPSVISLDKDSSAIVLQLTLQEFEEWTADGRTDGGTTCYPSLYNVVQVKPTISP